MGCNLPFYAFVSFWKGIHVTLAETQPHVMCVKVAAGYSTRGTFQTYLDIGAIEYWLDV